MQVSFPRASHSKSRGISSAGRLFFRRVRDLYPLGQEVYYNTVEEIMILQTSLESLHDNSSL